ncbi:MAG: hypothetical protein MJB12_03325, partial [Firmicutes bacterium]|nr:hypothetical protein [Bacillota bacterium]
AILIYHFPGCYNFHIITTSIFFSSTGQQIAYFCIKEGIMLKHQTPRRKKPLESDFFILSSIKSGISSSEVILTNLLARILD